MHLAMWDTYTTSKNIVYDVSLAIRNIGYFMTCTYPYQKERLCFTHGSKACTLFNLPIAVFHDKTFQVTFHCSIIGGVSLQNVKEPHSVSESHSVT